VEVRPPTGRPGPAYVITVAPMLREEIHTLMV
jgi:hypothetical protein